MKSILAGVILLLSVQVSVAQVAYKLYNKNGKEVSYDKMVKTLSKSDVVLFGELHNNPICHWLQLSVTQSLFEINGKLTLGAEMFESDGQLLIDEYFAGQISQKSFEKEMRLWNNYKTDYKPLLEFANTNKLKFVATNIPRRYASMVNYHGFESLDSLTIEGKSYIMPLPMVYDTNNPSAQKMMTMDFGHGVGGPKVEAMVKSQSTKDATMAHFILANLENKTTFLHFQGDFHSANYGGIYWYLKYWENKLTVSTISTVEADGDLEFKEEYATMGDYILVIPDDMTKTF
tara:strand:+ start:216816 stop:217682 length:867 start_codon:yes stop_codon:yes gene_type:complete